MNTVKELDFTNADRPGVIKEHISASVGTNGSESNVRKETEEGQVM